MLATMTCRAIRHGPETRRPPTGQTCQLAGVDAGPARATAAAGSAGRSAVSRSSSARVLAEVACSIRWLNSSSVSRPSPAARLSRSTVASRSASEALMPPAGRPSVVSPIAASSRAVPATTIAPADPPGAGRCRRCRGGAGRAGGTPGHNAPARPALRRRTHRPIKRSPSPVGPSSSTGAPKATPGQRRRPSGRHP
jgi:hypothetical protein